MFQFTELDRAVPEADVTIRNNIERPTLDETCHLLALVDNIELLFVLDTGVATSLLDRSVYLNLVRKGCGVPLE